MAGLVEAGQLRAVDVIGKPVGGGHGHERVVCAVKNAHRTGDPPDVRAQVGRRQHFQTTGERRQTPGIQGAEGRAEMLRDLAPTGIAHRLK